MEWNKNFEGLRAYGVLAVVLEHSIFMISPSMEAGIHNIPLYEVSGFYNKLTKLLFMLCNGKVGVCLFFMISGLILFRSLLTQNQQQKKCIALSFVIKRLFRLYIPLWFSLSLFFGLFVVLHAAFPSIFKSIPLSALIENALLHKITINGATWTLQAEVVAIVFILGAYYAFLNFGIKALLLMTFLATASLDTPILQYQFIGINSWIFLFFLGFLCALFPGEKASIYLKQLGWKWPLACLLSIRGLFPLSSNIALVSEALCAAYILVYLDSNIESKLSMVLSSKPMQFYGKISFSFYLINVMVLNIIYPFVEYSFIQRHPLEWGLAVTMIVFIVTTPMAYYSQRYIEQPSTRFASKLVKKMVSLIKDEVPVEQAVEVAA